jgi:hypothetical protein
MPAENVSYGLVRQPVAQVSQSTNDAVISPAGVLSRYAHHQGFHFRRHGGPAGVLAMLGAIEFLGTSLRYQARMVSGLATQATSRSTLRPSCLPISASVTRSGSLKRNREGNFARKMRFSAAKYSLRRSTHPMNTA